MKLEFDARLPSSFTGRGEVFSRDKLNTVAARWDNSAERYSEIVKAELRSEQAAAWREMFLHFAPRDGGLHILDVGTGPGFFPALLGSENHRLTGIDAAPLMLEQARRNAADHRVQADFLVMDGHALEFPDDHFDMVIGRNVTWTLYDPQVAFREWLRVLRPGGCLVYTDANWNPITYSEEKEAAVDKDLREYRRRYGEPFDSYRGSETDMAKFKQMVNLDHNRRPEWDEEHLPGLGYDEIEVLPRINERVLSEEKRLLYAHRPVFLVAARKPK